MVFLRNLFDSFNEKTKIEFDLIENTDKVFAVVVQNQPTTKDTKASVHIRPIYAFKESQIIEIPVFVSESEALLFKDKTDMTNGHVVEIQMEMIENSLYVMKNLLAPQVLNALLVGWNVHTVLYGMTTKNDVKKITLINKYWADDNTVIFK